MAGKALLLLGSQLLFEKQHKLVEKDLKTNQDMRKKKKREHRSLALRKELFILVRLITSGYDL